MMLSISSQLIRIVVVKPGDGKSCSSNVTMQFPILRLINLAGP